MEKMVLVVVGAIMLAKAIIESTAEVLISPFAYGGEVEMVDFCSRV